jgi:hypothetical protein
MLRRTLACCSATPSTGGSSKLTEPQAMKSRSRSYKLDFFRKSSASSSSRVGLFTRFRAWYLGAENLDVFSRYGSSSMLRHVINEWRGSALAAFMVLIVMWNHETNQRADDVLDAFERNRRKFYKRDFAPIADPNAPHHDGPHGFTYVDPAAKDGLKVDMDSNFVGPPRMALRRFTETLDVSPRMVRDAKFVRDAVMKHKAPE